MWLWQSPRSAVEQLLGGRVERLGRRRPPAAAGRPAPRRRSDSATQRAVTSPTPLSRTSSPAAREPGELVGVAAGERRSRRRGTPAPGRSTRARAPAGTRCGAGRRPGRGSPRADRGTSPSFRAAPQRGQVGFDRGGAASACAYSTPKLKPFSADAPSSRSTRRATTVSWCWPSAFCSSSGPWAAGHLGGVAQPLGGLAGGVQRGVVAVVEGGRHRPAQAARGAARAERLLRVTAGAARSGGRSRAVESAAQRGVLGAVQRGEHGGPRLAAKCRVASARTGPSSSSGQSARGRRRRARAAPRRRARGPGGGRARAGRRRRDRCGRGRARPVGLQRAAQPAGRDPQLVHGVRLAAAHPQLLGGEPVDLAAKVVDEDRPGRPLRPARGRGGRSMRSSSAVAAGGPGRSPSRPAGGDAAEQLVVRAAGRAGRPRSTPDVGAAGPTSPWWTRRDEHWRRRAGPSPSSRRCHRGAVRMLPTGPRQLACWRRGRARRSRRGPHPRALARGGRRVPWCRPPRAGARAGRGAASTIPAAASAVVVVSCGVQHPEAASAGVATRVPVGRPERPVRRRVGQPSVGLHGQRRPSRPCPCRCGAARRRTGSPAAACAGRAARRRGRSAPARSGRSPPGTT